MGAFTLTNLDKLIKPDMPTLGEYGTELYHLMIQAERNAIFEYINGGQIYYFASQEYPHSQIESLEDFKSCGQRGRTLLIVDSKFNHDGFTDSLYHSRREFINHLQIISADQNLKLPNVGVRSTSHPTLINFFAKKVKYSYNKAYRSSTLTVQDIDSLFEYKIEKLEQSMGNSTENHQYSRISDYTERLELLKTQQEKLKGITTNIVGRSFSGYALKLRAIKKGTPTINFGIKNIAIIYSETPEKTQVTQSQSRNKPNTYGECLLDIKELNIEIYKAK
ncbi:MAG: hypothetical protein RIR39_1142 [Pseudomonadota bacterium]